MQRTTIYNKVLAIAILTLTLTACVKDHLYDDFGYDDQPEQPTEPDQPTEATQGGVAAVEINLPDGTDNNDFTVELDGAIFDLGDGTQFQSDTLTAGEYDVLVYNTPQGVTVTDGIAYVDTEAGQPDVIISNPDQLYSGTGSVIVTEDNTTQVSVSVKQITRDLRIELTITEGDPDRITSITGTLSGIAGAYDLQNGTLCGDPVSTNTAFSVDGDQVTTDLTLLGTMGDTQTLTLHIVYTNGDTQDIVCDLSELLADFNDGTTPLTITANLRTPVESGYEASITGWQQADGGNTDAH